MRITRTEHAAVGKPAALELCTETAGKRPHSAPTDDQLDQAAPFSLSFGAPVSAQFVIEDHALRQWHHLARMRKALGH